MKRIAGYRIVAPIGVGSSATVYRAVQEPSQYEVAIKVLAENLSLIPESRSRFLSEVKLMTRITCPAIAQVYEVGETDEGQPYMVMELADRGDLRQRLAELRGEGQTVGWIDLWHLGSHLHEGLRALHDGDIVHRDVSPGNILIQHRGELEAWQASTLLGPGERLLLADLGFAKELEWASGLTAGGGTKGFAAPEQMSEVSVVDNRADIFSATAVLDWTVYDSPFADDLEAFVVKGLAEDPKDRYQTIDEWFEEFQRAMEAASIRSQNTGWWLTVTAFGLTILIALITLWVGGYFDSILPN